MIYLHIQTYLKFISKSYKLNLKVFLSFFRNFIIIVVRLVDNWPTSRLSNLLMQKSYQSIRSDNLCDTTRTRLLWLIFSSTRTQSVSKKTTHQLFLLKKIHFFFISNWYFYNLFVLSCHIIMSSLTYVVSCFYTNRVYHLYSRSIKSSESSIIRSNRLVFSIKWSSPTYPYL